MISKRLLQTDLRAIITVKKVFHILFAATALVVLSACLSPAPRPVARTVTLENRQNIEIGISTKETVFKALGKTKSVHFDSGYEIWVYPYENGEIKALALAEPPKDESIGGRYSSNEFVILFSPSGLVTKTRIRLAASDPKAKDGESKP